MPSRIEATVQLSVPLTLAYRRGTSFESFPDFLPGVSAVHVLEDARLRFHVDLGGASHQWEARVAERVRNRLLALESDDPLPISGVFEFVSERRGITLVRAQVSYEIDPLRGRLLEMLIDPQRQLEDGLGRFAERVEAEHGRAGGPSRPPSAGARS